jgi:hypothetical protein
MEQKRQHPAQAAPRQAAKAQQRIDAVIHILEMQIGCSEMLYAEGHEYYGDAYEQLRDECTLAALPRRAHGTATVCQYERSG